MTAASSTDIKKSRNIVAEVLLQCWMGLSLLSLLPTVCYSMYAGYLLLTGMANGVSGIEAAVLLPEDKQHYVVAALVLGLNFAMFQFFCKIVIDPRAGLAVMLRSDEVGSNK